MGRTVVEFVGFISWIGVSHICLSDMDNGLFFSRFWIWSCFSPLFFCLNFGVHLQKWSKGKQKEKVNNMVLFDQASYDKLLTEVPKYKLITPSILSDRLRV